MAADLDELIGCVGMVVLQVFVGATIAALAVGAIVLLGSVPR